jgi:cell division protein FtsN
MEDKVVTPPAKTKPSKQGKTNPVVKEDYATENRPKTNVEAPKNVPPKTTNTPKPIPTTQKQPINTPPAATKSTATSSVYMVHVLSWPNQMDRNTGKLALLTNVKEEKSGNEYNYLTGPFTTKEEADLMLTEIKQMGFKTAKLVVR